MLNATVQQCNPFKKPKQVHHCIMYDHIFFMIAALTLRAYRTILEQNIKEQPVK